MKKRILIVSIMLIALLVASCQTTQVEEVMEPPQGEPDSKEDMQEAPKETTQGENTMNRKAIFETSQGSFTLELYEDLMPITTGNFIKLAQEGFYDDTRFHRVIPNFMIQGGDPLSKDTSKRNRWGTGDPGYKIKDEHVANPKLSNVVGTISMANAGPESGGSQFFINVNDNTFLDFDKQPASSKHPVFGKVTQGLDIVMKISEVPTRPGDQPLEDVVVNKVRIE